jgi:hypothetical protein
VTDNEEITYFYAQIGIALTGWSAVEVALFNLGVARDHGTGAPAGSSNAYRSIEPATLMSAFYAIESFRNRLNFANALIVAFLQSEEERATWSALRDRVDRASIKRNRLAHWQVARYRQGKPGRRIVLQKWGAPGALPNTIYPTGSAPSASLGVVTIVEYQLEFIYLHHRLADFARSLNGEPEIMPFKNGPPAAPAFHELEDEIRGFLSRPLRKPTRSSAAAQALKAPTDT